jgi:hypothetical protein
MGFRSRQKKGVDIWNKSKIQLPNQFLRFGMGVGGLHLIGAPIYIFLRFDSRINS